VLLLLPTSSHFFFPFFPQKFARALYDGGWLEVLELADSGESSIMGVVVEISAIYLVRSGCLVRRWS
jgi:hypothetical protein